MNGARARPATARGLAFAVVSAFCVLVTVSCGGGGSSSGGTQVPTLPVSPPDPAPPAPAPGFDQMRAAFRAIAEWQPAWTLIKADYAYARGATGQSVTVGVIDTGVDEGHPKFSGDGKLVAQNDPGYNPSISDCPGTCQFGHGTSVSGLIAANRDPDSIDGTAMHGVAFDANLIVRGRCLEVSFESELCKNVVNPGNVARFNSLIPNVDIINNSYSTAGLLDTNGNTIRGSIEIFTQADIRAVFPNQIAAAAQTTTDAADRTIFVWSAGNERGETWTNPATNAVEDVNASSPTINGGMVARIAELQGHYLVVVNVYDEDDNAIVPSSNRCGIAKMWCLAAPGNFVRAPQPNTDPNETNDDYTLFSGTSAAAPVVSGALAVLIDRFTDANGTRQLGNTEVVTRLLTTANSTGIYADEDVYGHGLVDLDAATRPMGMTGMTTGTSLTDTRVDEQLSRLASAPAFGDAWQRALAGHQIAVFDELDAPFMRPLSGYLQTADTASPRMTERLSALGYDHSAIMWSANRLSAPRLFLGLGRAPSQAFGLHADILPAGTFSDRAAFANPFLGLVHDGNSGSLGLERQLAGNEKARQAVSANLASRAQGTSSPGTRRLRFGLLRGRVWEEAHSNAPHRATGVVLEYASRQQSSSVRRVGFAEGGSSVASGLVSGFSVQGGYLREPEGLIGSRVHGAFGDLASGTVFLGLSAHKGLSSLARRWPGVRGQGTWRVYGSAHLGVSRPSLKSHGMVREVSRLSSSAWGVGVTGANLWHPQDRLSLRISQPLRIERGTAQLRYATGRTRYRELLLKQQTLSLAPSARELQIELAYALPIHASDRACAKLFPPGMKTSTSFAGAETGLATSTATSAATPAMQSYERPSHGRKSHTRKGQLHLATIATHNPNHSRTATRYALLLRYKVAL